MEPIHVERSSGENLPAPLRPCVAKPSPFCHQRLYYHWSPGDTLADILYALVPDTSLWADMHLYIAGQEITREYWHVVHPRPGQEVLIIAVPRKDALRTLLTIALIVVASQIAGPLAGKLTGQFVGSTFATAVTQAAIVTVGLLAINALIPIVPAELGNYDDNITRRTLSIAGARNPVAPFAPIPVMLGKHILYPPYAAAPYSELVGDDQYAIMLFVLGYRNLEIDPATIKFGDIPISTYADLEYELYSGGSNDVSRNAALGPITLYPNIADENVVSAKIVDTGWVQSNTALNVDRVVYEIHFPGGITTDQRGALTVNVAVEYSSDSVVWVPLDVHPFTAASTQGIRRGFQWRPPTTGQWFIRMKADQPGDNTTTRFWERYFAVLRSFQSVNPVTHPDVALLAIRVRATDQLNGVPDNVNLVMQSIVQDFVGRCWGGESTTNLLLHSNDFSNAVWVSGAITETPNVINDSEGNLTAWKLDDTLAGTNADQMYQEFTIPNDTISRTYSVEIKEGTSTQSSFHLTFDNGGTVVSIATVIDWATKTFTNPSFATFTPLDDGWYRVSLTTANNGTGNLRMRTWIRPAYFVSPTVGTGYIYASKAQLVNDVVPGVYAPTTTVPAIAKCSDGVFSTYDLNFLTGLGGWVANGTATLVHNPAEYTATWTPTGTDPNLSKSSGLTVDGRVYQRVRMRAKLVSGVINSWEGNCWFRTSAFGFISGNSVRVVPSPFATLDRWYTLEWDFSTLGNYITEPSVTGFRIDLVSTNVGAPVFKIDYVDVVYLEDWPERPTSNPASLARYILQGEPNARALADNRIDLGAVEHFHDFCKDNGFEYNKPVEGDVTLWDILQQVCAVGRARPLQIDGLWTFKVDEPQPFPIQIFSPRNSRDFSGEKVFPDPVHAYRVRFIDSQANYNNDEQIVYTPGYDVTTAVNFEALEFPGVTLWDHIWKLAQYYIAVTIQQPESFNFNTDIENLVCLPMDRIEYQDDAILVGLGAARVKSVTVTGCVLDGEVTMGPGGDGFYAVKFRRSTGVIAVYPVKTVVGSTTALTFHPALTSIPAAAGDLAIFGEYGRESIDLLVKNIIPGADLTAQLVCIPYSEAIYNADGGLIPPYDPTVTFPPGSRVTGFESLRSDESVLFRDSGGNLVVTIQGTLLFATVRSITTTGIIVQYRFRVGGVNSATWSQLPILAADAKNFTLSGVQEGDQYEFRVALLFNNGQVGVWTDYVDPVTGVNYHTVIGKTSLPPDLSILTVTYLADGTRVYDWDFPTGTLIPQDLDGFEIRYYDYDVDPDPAPLWTDMTQLRTVGRLTEGPYEANAPFAGDWVFAIRARDTGGRLSVNPKYSTVVSLPPPRTGNTIAYRNAWENSWDGPTRTSCHVGTVTGYLEPDDTTTWADMGTWGTGLWARDLAPSIEYIEPVWDFGAAQNAVWLATLDYNATGGAAVTTYIRQHATDITLAAWVVFNSSTTYTLRYQQFRLVGANIKAEGIRNAIFSGAQP